MSNPSERRIVVEVFSHPEAERLRQEMLQLDKIHRDEIAALESRLEGLHRTFYEYLNSLCGR